MKKILFTLALFISTTSVVYAATTFNDIIKMFGSILNAIIPVIIALAIVWTLYFVLKFIKEEGDKRAEYSKSFMFGIVGIFVMLSLWGLINLLDQTFGLDNTPNISIPTVGTVVAPTKQSD